MGQLTFDLRACSVSEVAALCREYHGYGGAGGAATYAFAVYENGRAVAAYQWQPPPYGAAKAVCPEAPYAVLSLSRMVAVPACDRSLKHVSKPLLKQMKTLIDRTRWPVLLTYSDRGQGYTGYVYRCSGWSWDGVSRRPTYLLSSGQRVSSYSNGAHVTAGKRRGRDTTLDRWVHRVCEAGRADAWMRRSGWVRVEVPGKRWRSGPAAFTVAHRPELAY